MNNTNYKEALPPRYEPEIAKRLRGDDQQGGDNFPVRLCPSCHKYFEVTKHQRKTELHFYNDHYYGVEKETCPVCLGGTNFTIITDTMTGKIVGKTKKTGYGKSGYLGVSYMSKSPSDRAKKRKKAWRATIVINNKKKSLGVYYSEIGAARAYNKEAKKLGRKLNIIT